MRTTGWLVLVGVAVAAPALVTSLGCGGNDDPYKVTPAWSGKKANLPPVPQLPTSPVKVGDAYSVYGAIHHLNSRIHKGDVTGKDISIVGYIVDSNISTAPACAVHATGKKDPENCVTEIPTFTIADTKGDKSGQKIRVMGWASNFANVYDAMQKYKNAKDPPKHADKPDNAGKPGYLMQDELWAVDIPYPLPSVGAKVKVTGRYGTIFGKASSGLVSDPMSGVITYGSIETIEPPTEPAAFMAKNGK